ncbi:MAG TPA: DoxX family protein [Phycisphaerae bacterium]|nr:DoxX family protein [Phycisphaerae bacterium]
MASSPKQLQNLVLLVNRLALGLYFALAGWGKITGGITAFYEKSFVVLKPAWLPTWFAAPYGHLLPFAEMILGAMMAIGLMGRLSAGLLALMLASFTIALASAGAFFSGPGPFHANVIFLALAILLAGLGPGNLSADTIWRRRRRRMTGL